MHYDKILSAIREIIEPALSSMDKELAHLEFIQESGRWILRLYVDRLNASGITVDELSEISRDISALLDVNDAVPGKYYLEVSSPGLDRPLGKIEDCVRFAGKAARISTRELVEGQRNFKGILRGAEGTFVLLEDETNKICKIPWGVIRKANLLGELKLGQGQGA